jgi:predicted transcriptional regulator
MLESASDGAISKTRLMYMSYLSHEKMTRFATILIKNDLLSFDSHRHLFSTTAKGQKFLKIYNRMQQCVDSLEDDEEQHLFYKKEGYWQNELKSLGIESKRKNDLNDPKELQNLADALKLSMYQDYKTAYSEQGNKHREEAESTIGV